MRDREALLVSNQYGLSNVFISKFRTDDRGGQYVLTDHATNSEVVCDMMSCLDSNGVSYTAIGDHTHCYCDLHPARVDYSTWSYLYPVAVTNSRAPSLTADELACMYAMYTEWDTRGDMTKGKGIIASIHSNVTRVLHPLRPITTMADVRACMPHADWCEGTYTLLILGHPRQLMFTFSNDVNVSFHVCVDSGRVQVMKRYPEVDDIDDDSIGSMRFTIMSKHTGAGGG